MYCYKVVFNDNGRYRSIIAGNRNILFLSDMLAILPSVEYKVGEFVSGNTPLLVFNHIDYAKRFVISEQLDLRTQCKIFTCEIVPSESIVSHVLAMDFPSGTVFADKVKLLWEVDNEVL